MIIYHVTVKIDPSVHEEWLQWMIAEHIPQVMATGFFLESRISRMLYTEEEDGMTYGFQYLLESEDDLRKYMESAAPVLQKDHADRYRDKFVAYRTVHEVIKNL
jgi:hypothetical protein